MEMISMVLQRWYSKFKSYFLSEHGMAMLFLVFTFVITMPMFVAGAFSHPSADDYSFCIYTYKAVQSSNDLQFFLMLKGAFEAVKEAYLSWSGYYTGSFLAALRPNFYNENFAFFNSFILLGGFITGVFVSVKKLLNGLCGFSKYVCCMVSCVIIIVATQFVPSVSETFYWYTAGITYTLLFATSLVLVTNLLTGVYRNSISWQYCIGNAILAFIVAGGILPVNIPTLGIMTLILLDVVLGKRFKGFKNLKIKFLVIYIVFFIGMLIGSLSPSTFWRLDNLGETQSVSLFYALIYSIYGSCSTIISFVTPSVVITAFVVVIITVFSLKTVDCKFEHPFFVTFIAWCVMFGAYFPIFYGTGFKLQYSDSRYNSIIFFHFIIWMCVLTIYWTGWIYQKVKGKRKDILRIGAMVALLLLATIAREERREPWSINIIKDFANGTIVQYDKEMDERYADFLDKDKLVVTITYPTKIPVSLFQEEPIEGTWSLSILEDYFDKEKIIIRKYMEIE